MMKMNLPLRPQGLSVLSESLTVCILARSAVIEFIVAAFYEITEHRPSR